MPRLVVACVVILAACPAARALPDLTPEIYELDVASGQTVAAGDVADGCATATDGRTLVRFGVRARNVGTEALVLGATGCPDCSANPGAACGNPDFECSLSGTPRAVFLSSSRYELLDMAGNVVALGAKRNYCFLDDCVPPDQRTFADCANNQGVSVGCFDDYEPELACQYIDATGVPGIATNAFRVRVTIDPENLLPDANRGNNVTEMVLPGCGDGVVQSGEQCDGGPCCDAACHLMPAGSTCRPAAGPCDVAEVCDGVSPVCPSDANAPDGTSCGPGLPPCSVEECESGACVTQPDTTRGCVIAGACVAPGTADSADACRRCDPSQRSDAWTPIRDPNAHGVACGLARASTVAQTAACPRQTVRAVARRLQRAGGIADALSGARPRRAVRRLLRLVQGTIHLVEASKGCASGDLDAELQSVRDALRAMAQG